jgi:hypothetical protein
MVKQIGCSSCPPGQEKHSEFIFRKNKLIHYDYRTPEGVLFSTIQNSLREAQMARDRWFERLFHRPFPYPSRPDMDGESCQAAANYESNFGTDSMPGSDEQPERGY